jgi:uncharacterized protein YjbJ (UPF0337 family)
VKDAFGIIADDSALEQEGSRQQADGAVRRALAKRRRKVGEYIDRVARTIQK